MAAIVMIPIVLVAIIGLSGYLIYKFLIYDILCKKRVNDTLAKYGITKSPAQIIREYHAARGENLADARIREMEKSYRQKEPEQFLAMYDSLRDNPEKH